MTHNVFGGTLNPTELVYDAECFGAGHTPAVQHVSGTPSGSVHGPSRSRRSRYRQPGLQHHSSAANRRRLEHSSQRRHAYISHPWGGSAVCCCCLNQILCTNRLLAPCTNLLDSRTEPDSVLDTVRLVRAPGAVVFLLE